MDNPTHEKLKVLSKYLKDADLNTFSYDPYSGGSLERGIAYAQVQVMHEIGNFIEEILTHQEWTKKKH